LDVLGEGSWWECGFYFGEDAAAFFDADFVEIGELRVLLCKLN
jgi:hypothetical protein